MADHLVPVPGVGLWRLSFDPGAVHVGMATMQGLRCVQAVEYDPQGAYRVLESALSEGNGPVEEVIIEEFRLYPWKLQEQGFREMLTSECIGVLKYICDRAGVVWVQQPASIQKVTEARMKEQGVRLVSRGNGPHAKSAELHGLYRVWKLEEAKSWDG